VGVPSENVANETWMMLTEFIAEWRSFSPLQKIMGLTEGWSKIKQSVFNYSRSQTATKNNHSN